jgi:hypothetical protein
LVTVRVKVCGRVAVADGRGEGVGVALLGETLGVVEGKTTRDGPQSRTTKNPMMNTTARNASRARDLTP